ncbi:hypothetical protein Tco_1434567, partial [Tanacetum coccineum]
QLHALVDGKKVLVTESSVRKDLQLEDAEGVDSLPIVTIFEQLTLMRLGKGFSGRDTPLFPTMMVQAQEEIGEGSANPTIIQPSSSQPQQKQQPRRSKKKDTQVPKPSGLITNVVDETWEILLLKLGRKIDDIDAEEGITLVDENAEDQGRIDDEVMFDVSDLVGEEVFVAEKGLKMMYKAQSERNCLQRSSEINNNNTNTNTFRGLRQRLQAELQAEVKEEERLAREKEEEANIALIESWDNTQAMIDVDYQLDEQLQAQEQEELTIEEKSKSFVQLLEARKKHFAALRAKEKRNKPPTKAQKRTTMSTYLKNMVGYKHTKLKNKSFNDIQKLFNKEMKRVNTFVDMDT